MEHGDGRCPPQQARTWLNVRAQPTELWWTLIAQKHMGCSA
jgi:hypothetical protein